MMQTCLQGSALEEWLSRMYFMMMLHNTHLDIEFSASKTCDTCCSLINIHVHHPAKTPGSAYDNTHACIVFLHPV